MNSTLCSSHFKFGENMENIFERFIKSRVGQAVSFTAFVLLVIVLLVAGASVAAVLLLVAIVLLCIYLGSIEVLVGSIVLAVLLKHYTEQLKSFAEIFVGGQKLDQFTGLVQRTETTDLIIIAFFFYHLLAFTTSCVQFRLVALNSTTTTEDKDNEKKKEGEEKKDPKNKTTA